MTVRRHRLRLGRTRHAGRVVPPSRLAIAAAGDRRSTPGPAREPSGSTATRARRRGALKVVTTTTVFADIVQNLGGSRVAVELDHPAGRRARGLRAQARRRPDACRRPADRLQRRRARRLPRSAPRVGHAAADAARWCSATASRPITVDGEANPHFWLDPTLVKQHYLPAIAAKLTELDPAGAATFDANAAAYGAQLDALDAELKAKVEHDPGRRPQARHVPRRVPVLRAALRVRARRGHPRERRPGAAPRPISPRSSRRSRRPASRRSSARRSSARSWPQTLADEAGISTSSRPSTTTPSAPRRPTRTSA